MQFNNTEIFNFKGAFRGLRNPLESWKKSDSCFEIIDINYDDSYDIADSYVASNGYDPNIDYEAYDEAIDKTMTWLEDNGILRSSGDGLFDVAFIGPNDLDLAKRMIALSNAKNVEIKYTGLREGEKLYEEVLNELEGTKPTFHEKIRIAEVREYDYEAVCKDIDELVEISKQYDNMETVRKMKEIVPEYKSNNSVYEEIDREIERNKSIHVQEKKQAKNVQVMYG